MLHRPMRIVSRFTDYYDGLRSLDREDTPLYVRETTTTDLAGLTVRAREALLVQVGALWRDDVVPPFPDAIPGAERVVVGFCGRAFSGILAFGEVCWDLDEVLALVDVRVTDRGERDIMRQQLTSTSTSRWRPGLNRATWERHVAGRRQDIGPAPFIALRAPVVVVTDRSLMLNPCLRDQGFARQVDPYAAWQELSLFLGNTLLLDAPPPPRPVDDALKAHAHGFDGQSFRNTKKRPKANRSDW
jgi:hypothetical protein